MVNFFFVEMKIGKFVDVDQKNLEITLKMMKNTWKFTEKPRKVMEFCQSRKVGTLHLPRCNCQLKKNHCTISYPSRKCLYEP